MRLALPARCLAVVLLALVWGCGDSSPSQDGGTGGARQDAGKDAVKDGGSDAKGGAAGGQGGGTALPDGGAPDGGTGGVGGGGGSTGGVAGSAGAGGKAGAGQAGAGGQAGKAGNAGNGGSAVGGKGGQAGAGQAGAGGKGGVGGQGGTATVPTCSDGAKNSDETDIDCGGHCGPCGPGKRCGGGNDCSVGLCLSNVCAQCAAPTDCEGVDLECSHRTCTNGACGRANEVNGKVLASQTVGDCKVRKCGAEGNVVDGADTTDKPVDPNPCVVTSCNGMTQVKTPLAAGSTCGPNNMVCNDKAQCVGCLTAATCPGSDNACRTRTCENNVCGATLQPENTKVTDPKPGDCKGVVCDGSGSLKEVPVDSDLPTPTLCVVDHCASGVLSKSPVDIGTACADGKVCDGANNCVQCLTAATCPGADTECQTRTCKDGICGTAPATMGKVLAAQLEGDCKKAVCDGAGNVSSTIDPTDLPNDNLPCTDDICSGGTPMNTPKTQGTMCGTNQVCDNAGQCVGCNVATDCGLDDECSAYACTNHVCSVMRFENKVVATQTSADCKVRVCDANGNVVDKAEPTDNNDGNQCTDDACVDGQPQHTPAAPKTSCSQSGGTMCNGGPGVPQCVTCVEDVDCAGTRNACQHPSCNNGVCEVVKAAAGTALPSDRQTANDCHKMVCDADGNEVPAIDNTDVPASDNNQCTAEVCNNGVGAHNGTPGQACSDNGGSICDNETTPRCSPVVWAVRVGDGSGALTSAAQAVYLERIALLDGSDAGSPLSLPIADSGNNKAFSLSGTADSEGALALSKDGHVVTLAGYNATPGTASVAGTTLARTVAFVQANGAVDTTTLMSTDFTGDNVRSAVSSDGMSVWVAGNAGSSSNRGVWATTKGGTTVGTRIGSASTRVCQIWLGQLYCTTSSVLTTFGGPDAPSTSITTASGIITGVSTGTGPSPFGFALFDLTGDNQPDVLYLADDRTSANGGGILRFKVTSFTPGTATTSTTMTVAYETTIGAAPANIGPIAFTGAFRGLTAYQDIDGKIVLVGSMPGYIVKYVDDRTTNGPSIPGVLVKTAGTNTIYRGVALSPR